MELINGNGCGYGYGNGDGSGYGCGYGDGNGYGYGYGDGSGYGYGYGYGNGSGSGDGYGYGYGYEVILPEKSAFECFHFCKVSDGKLILRDGSTSDINEVLRCQDAIVMCSSGYHASFTREDAVKYRPCNSKLTQVKVWGNVIIARDKLVAEYRKCTKILE